MSLSINLPSLPTDSFSNHNNNDITPSKSKFIKILTPQSKEDESKIEDSKEDSKNNKLVNGTELLSVHKPNLNRAITSGAELLSSKPNLDRSVTSGTESFSLKPKLGRAISKAPTISERIEVTKLPKTPKAESKSPVVVESNDSVSPPDQANSIELPNLEAATSKIPTIERRNSKGPVSNLYVAGLERLKSIDSLKSIEPKEPTESTSSASDIVIQLDRKLSNKVASPVQVSQDIPLIRHNSITSPTNPFFAESSRKSDGDIKLINAFIQNSTDLSESTPSKKAIDSETKKLSIPNIATPPSLSSPSFNHSVLKTPKNIEMPANNNNERSNSYSFDHNLDDKLATSLAVRLAETMKTAIAKAESQPQTRTVSDVEDNKTHHARVVNCDTTPFFRPNGDSSVFHNMMANSKRASRPIINEEDVDKENDANSVLAADLSKKIKKQLDAFNNSQIAAKSNDDADVNELSVLHYTPSTDSTSAEQSVVNTGLVLTPQCFARGFRYSRKVHNENFLVDDITVIAKSSTFFTPQFNNDNNDSSNEWHGYNKSLINRVC